MYKIHRYIKNKYQGQIYAFDKMLEAAENLSESRKCTINHEV